MKQLIVGVFALLLAACSSQVSDPVMASYDNAFSQWQLETNAPENVLTHAYDISSEGNMPAQESLPWQQAMQANRLFTCHFQTNSAVLADADIQHLAALKQRIASDPNAHLIIAGYANEKGSRAYDLMLAWKRAFVVAQYLEHFGVDHDMISIVAMGKAASKYARQPGMASLHKSVEIIYEKE